MSLLTITWNSNMNKLFLAVSISAAFSGSVFAADDLNFADDSVIAKSQKCDSSTAATCPANAFGAEARAAALNNDAKKLSVVSFFSPSCI